MKPSARTGRVRVRAARPETERSRAAGRARIYGILAALPDALWSAELRGERLLYVSPGANAVFGCSPQALLACRAPHIELVHPDDRAALLRAWSDLPASGGFDVDYRIVAADGTTRWINDRARVVRDGAGIARRIDGLARDVTLQMEHRRRAEGLCRVRELTGAINTALIRLRDRDALLAEVCRVAIAVGGLRGARIDLLDETTGAVAQSFAAGKIAAADLRRDAATAPASGAVAATFPLQLEGRVIGALLLDAEEPGAFDEEEIRLLQEAAANIGTALEQLRQKERLGHYSLYDALTELPNRTLFRDRLTQALEAERRGGSRLALMVFDIERFKAVNHAYGQQSGDRLLQQVASGLRAAVGDINRVARLGGDVFGVMFPALQDADNMAMVLRAQAARIFRDPFVVEGRELHLMLKAGIAIFPEDGGDADTLFRNAEAALKRARETGERHLFYAPEINARVSERMELEQGLRKAIVRHEFVLHFQPKVDLDNGRIVGVEALIRWPRPGKGLVAPDILIPVLEQTGMILEVGQQVMVEAVATYRGWLARGLRAPRIAVNVSTVQLRQPDFCDCVRAAIAGSSPCGLDLEVTESLMMHNMDDAVRKLREVQAMGVGVSLDDFGTGYSSLARLARLPVDTLKIDRVFVSRMTDSPDDTSIVTAILSLGRSLNRTLIAEGVETEAQARLLRLLRCDQMQGNLYSAPLPLERLESLIFS